MVELKEVQKSVYTALEELGCSDLETKLYMVSLMLGPSPIAKIAEHLDISRPNVYKVITGLQKRGLANFIDKKKYARNFIVESPSIVLEKLRAKQESFSALDQKVTMAMPNLLAIYRQGETPTKIKVLEGKEQFIKLFHQILEEAKDQIEFFGSFNDWVSFISWDTTGEWAKKRTAKNVRVRVLALPSREVDRLKQKDSKELRETRILKGANPFTAAFSTFANKAIVWQPKTPLAVLVEDQYIVQMLRRIFYTLYDKSRAE